MSPGLIKCLRYVLKSAEILIKIADLHTKLNI